MDGIRSFGDKCIVNQNDVYLYFEIIRQIKPEKVIDAGMFLKRIGAVSRQAMNAEIGGNVKLWGIDCMPECSAKVYGTVYDRICSADEFLRCSEEAYDLAFMLKTEKCISASYEKNIIGRISDSASYLVLDEAAYERNRVVLAFRNYRELALDSDKYKIVIF